MPFPLLALLGLGSGAGAAGAGAAGAGAAGAGAAGAGAAGAAGTGAGLLGAAKALGAAGTTKAPSLLGSMLAMSGGGAANNPTASKMLDSLAQNAGGMGGMAQEVLQPPPAMAAPAPIQPPQMPVQGSEMGPQPNTFEQLMATQLDPATTEQKLSMMIQNLGGPKGLLDIAGRTRSPRQPQVPFPGQMPANPQLNPFDVSRAQSERRPLRNFGMARFRRA